MLRIAHWLGIDGLLVVPGAVDVFFDPEAEVVDYRDVFKRAYSAMRRLAKTAEEYKVTICVENVWNKFLLSPLEFARYVDEFDSPYLKAYFDVGNVILFGYSQDWIRTLGKRTVKIHLKDFKRKGYSWTNLGDGDVNWKEVIRALNEIGFEGYMTAELKGGDEAYLTDVAARIDRIFTSSAAAADEKARPK